MISSDNKYSSSNLVNPAISRNIKLILNSIGLLVGTSAAATDMTEGSGSVSGVSEALGLLCVLAIGYQNE